MTKEQNKLIREDVERVKKILAGSCSPEMYDWLKKSLNEYLIDALELETAKCPHCGVLFEYSPDFKCCEDCTI